MARLRGVFLVIVVMPLQAAVVPGCLEGARKGGQAGAVCEDEHSPRNITVSDDHAFDLGPYLMHTTSTSVVVMWRTLEAGPSVVEYGPGEVPDRTVTVDALVTVHEVVVPGLEPDTRYAYRAKTGAVTSALHHFHTAPGALSGFRFTVMGDSQGHPEVSGPIFRAMADVGPHFLLHVGDVVSNGRDPLQWKDQFLGPLGPLGHEVPTYVAVGNHERQAGDFFSLVSYPNDGEDPVLESSYSFRWGNGFFLVLDSNQLFWPIGGGETDLSWWVRDAVASGEARSATWRVAATHQAGYSEGWSPGECNGFDGMPAVRDFLLPLLAENRFHLLLSGHTHAYERGFRDGILQVITGGGGGGLDEWCRDWPHVTRHVAQHHWLDVRATCSTLELTAVGMDGGVIDQVALSADQPGVLVRGWQPPDGGR
jgi:predicted phosphodiesterase